MLIPPGLKRYPFREPNALQVWDQADALLLEEVSKRGPEFSPLLILHDHFGALTISLQSQFHITSYTDSYLASRAIFLQSDPHFDAVSDLEKIQGLYPLVIARLPKNLSYFDEVLCKITQVTNEQSEIIFTGMVKHIAKGHFTLIEKRLGKLHTSLAQKKARLIFTKRTQGAHIFSEKFRVAVPGFAEPLINRSHLFSREKLDIGTRFFLQHLPKTSGGALLDLACGNGVLGIAAAIKDPELNINFCDESAMAIQSTKANFERFFPGRTANYFWTNSFEEGRPESFEHVFCNPPFHEQNSLSDETAREMIQDAYRCLKPHGRLQLIGNRHLPYGRMLEKRFGSFRSVASHEKFLIWEAIKVR